MMSRVVPACGETIATSRRASVIHQRRLADIRRTRDRDHQPVAQPFTSPLCRKHFFDFRKQRFDLRQRRRDQFGRHVAFVGEIDPGFDQRRGLDDLRAPVARAVAEQALQLTQRLAALPVGVGMDQIVETFGLGEIELAVLERAAGEFAGLGGAHIFETPTSAANSAASTARPP